VRPRFASWNRAMVGGRKNETAKPDAPEAEPHYPLLLLAAAIVGAGLQCLFSLGGRSQSFS